MPLSFNLVDEPWLPVVWLDGRAGEVGLRDALVRAREIRELVDGSPLVTVSLHRLLLAILHRNFGPETFADWKDLWRAGQWEARTLDAYFSAWRHRFDLFDAERPFYQVAQHDDGAKLHPPALLAQELASGNNATVFDHSFSDRPVPIRLAEAARLLVARQAYSVGGGVGRPFNLSHAPLTVGFTVLALGESLFQTLALNLTQYGDGHPVRPSLDDAPVWEQTPPTIATEKDKDGVWPRGPLDYLTWQSRRIKLYASGDPPMVTGCQLGQNLKVHDETFDPFKSYAKSKDQGWVPRKLDPDRAIWRDSSAIFQQTDDGSRRAEVFNWLARVDEALDGGEIEAQRAYPLSVLGLGREPTAKAADISIWRHERFTVPLAYLHVSELLGRLERALRLAEDVGRLLKPGTTEITTADRASGKPKQVKVPRPFQLLAEAMLPTIGGKPDRKKVDALIDHLAPERRYWSRLEVPFRTLLIDLPNDHDRESDAYGARMLPAWAETLQRTARAAFEEATSGMDQSARSLQAVARAQRELSLRLHATLGEHLALRKGVTV